MIQRSTCAHCGRPVHLQDLNGNGDDAWVHTDTGYIDSGPPGGSYGDHNAEPKEA